MIVILQSRWIFPHLNNLRIEELVSNFKFEKLISSTVGLCVCVFASFEEAICSLFRIVLGKFPVN